MNENEKRVIRKVTEFFPHSPEYQYPADQVVTRLLAAGWTIAPPAAPPALTAAQLADETRYLCQHCGVYKPDLMFQLQTQLLPGIGFLQWLIIICGSCRRIHGHEVVYFQADANLVASTQQKLQEMIAGAKAQAKGLLI